MRHGHRKIKFGSGIDANRMIMRKLAYNFIKSGKMVTTEKRARALKIYLESIVHKSKTESDANKNYLLRKLGSTEVIKTLYTQVAPAAKDKNSGFVTVRRLHSRISDGASMVEIRWSMPVVLEDKKTAEIEAQDVTEETTEKKEAKVGKPAKKTVKKTKKVVKGGS